jgi:hypothetical protein
MDSKVSAAIGRIVEYNWNEEERDYALCSDEPGQNARTGHVFEDLRLVRRWLEGVAEHPAQSRGDIPGDLDLDMARRWVLSQLTEPADDGWYLATAREDGRVELADAEGGEYLVTVTEKPS